LVFDREAVVDRARVGERAERRAGLRDECLVTAAAGDRALLPLPSTGSAPISWRPSNHGRFHSYGNTVLEEPGLRSFPAWIEDFDLGLAEVGDVAGDDRQAVNQSRRRNQAVLDRHGRSSNPHISEEPCPPEAGLGCPVEAGDSANAAIEPLLQPPAASTRRQKLDPESQLTENDRIDGDLAFMTTEPVDDLGIGPRPRGLAEGICINEELRRGSQVVGRFRGDSHEEPLLRTRKQPVRQPLIGRWLVPEPVQAASTLSSS